VLAVGRWISVVQGPDGLPRRSLWYTQGAHGSKVWFLAGQGVVCSGYLTVSYSSMTTD